MQIWFGFFCDVGGLLLWNTKIVARVALRRWQSHGALNGLLFTRA